MFERQSLLDKYQMQDLAIICNIANIFVCHLEDDPYAASIYHKACLKDDLCE